MAEFSIQDAAFTGFRVVREHPKAVAIWALVALALSLIYGTVFISMAGPAFATLQTMSLQPSRDPAKAIATLAQLGPAYAVFICVVLVFNAFIYAAMNRVVLRPGDDRFGFLRIGADELRQLGLQLLAFAVFVGVYLGLTLVMTLLVIGLLAAAKAAAGIVVVLFVVAVACAMIFLAVRLSLASAQTFATGKVNLFGSWALTKGRFWPIFGTYVLTFALIMVVYLLSSLVVFAALAALAGGNPMEAMMHPDMSSLRAYMSPARLAQTLLGAGITALVWPLMFTPAATIYRSLAPTVSGDVSI